MFRKLNKVFRPNHQGQRGRDGGSTHGSRSEQDYHSACTVRLVRSTSLLVVGQRSQATVGSPLKRSRSTVSVESDLYCYQRKEDRIWLYSQSRDCLEYLEALVELRRKYCQTVGDFQRSEAKASASLKKKPPPPPPGKEEPVRIWNQFCRAATEEPETAIVSPQLFQPQAPRTRAPEPSVPDEEDTLRYLDAVIAGCESEAQHKPYTDDGHEDVDFIGEPQTSLFSSIQCFSLYDNGTSMFEFLVKVCVKVL